MEDTISYKSLVPGDIVFTRDGSYISKFIRYMSGEEFSHCLVYYGDGLIVEAVWGGVIITSIKKYINTKTTCVVAQLPSDIDRGKFKAEIVKFIGDKYDTKLFLGLLIKTMLSCIKLDLSAYNKGSNWLCYEFICKALSKLGVKFDKPIIEMSPYKLLEFFKNTEGVNICKLQRY